jgi:DNA-binding response OmpR family regulator
MRILLVEDDRMNTELFQATLESDGHMVAVESDGASGQERATLEKFDLIVLDVHLPRRDGIEVCRNLRRASINTPIVALSASVLPNEVARAKAAGFDQFLAKPIAPAQLRAAIRAIFAPGQA